MSENVAATPRVDVSRLILGVLVVVLAGTNVLAYYALGGPRGAAPQAPARDMMPAADNSALGDYPIINGHDHLYREQDVKKYLDAAEQFGIDKTLFVASSEFTFKGDKFSPKEGNEWSSREILRVSKLFPGKIIPFVTFHPEDTNKIELLKEYVAEGAVGVKLYSGHGNFYDRPLLAEEMKEFYAYCEANKLILCWHVNMNRYGEEFTQVLLQYPDLKVIIPHFGVGFFDPGGEVMQTLGKIMETYPNVYTDCSFGTRDILVSGLEKVSDSPDVFRAYFEKYQDKIIWGTDMVITGNKEKTTEWIAATLRACRDFLEKSDYYFWMAADGCTYSLPRDANPYGYLRGLKLPPEILKKLYRENLERLMAN